jgi:ABC-type nitrate/sulfonate/bicarbonate transport system substrate-binding protein
MGSLGRQKSNTQKSRRPLRRVGVASFAVAAVVVAGCSSSGSSGAPSGTNDGQQTQSLSIGVGAVGAFAAPIYLAEINGYWKDAGLNVSISNAGANLITLVAGGRIDLGYAGITSAFVPVSQGKDTTVVFGGDMAASTSVLAGIAGITSPDQCKRVTTASTGTSAATWASVYKQDLHESGWDIDNVTDPTAELATVLTGQSQCIVGTYLSMAQGFTTGKLHFLINPSDPSTIPSAVQALQQAPGASLFGLTDTLSKKQAALEPLEAGLIKAMQYMKSTPPATQAAALRTNGDWKSQDTATIVDTLNAEIPFLNPGNGLIPESSWAPALQFAKFVVPAVDPTAQEWSYAARVDMSSWNAANQ